MVESEREVVMCGIAGAINCEPFDVTEAIGRLRHRGPDGKGIAEVRGGVLGHVRLSVLDLSSASDQPFRYRDGVLTYNGELWNYGSLRDELIALGHTFRTTGDTEVVAAALSQWGASALDRFDGMFAFAWVSDTSAFLARDRFGKIPLYVATSDRGECIWSSERKGFGSRGLSAIAFQLPAGSLLELEPPFEIRVWYRIPVGWRSEDGSTLAKLETGVRRRLTISDAPVCCLISGGLDSALVLAISKKVNPDVVAYTAVFDEASPDLKAARALAEELRVELREVRVPEPTLETISEAVIAIECPLKAQVEIALAAIPLAHQIAADGFKVCLSGEGADELFGGYGSMCIPGSKASDWEWSSIRRKQVAKMARGNFLRCNLTFMAAGVECRLPFLERELVEYVLNLRKSDCPTNKRLLKIAAQPVLPKAVVTRKKETFQGGLGLPAAVRDIVDSPSRLYAEITDAAYGIRRSL